MESFMKSFLTSVLPLVYTSMNNRCMLGPQIQPNQSLMRVTCARRDECFLTRFPRRDDGQFHCLYCGPRRIQTENRPGQDTKLHQIQIKIVKGTVGKSKEGTIAIKSIKAGKLFFQTPHRHTGIQGCLKS